MTDSAALQARIDELLEEHGYITSVDGCCFCGDCECDGIGCIASLDANDETDHPTIERLHDLLRAGQAWQLTQKIIEAGETPAVALMIAGEALANAENRTMAAACERCGRHFGAQTPCDDTCTACRLAGVGIERDERGLIHLAAFDCPSCKAALIVDRVSVPDAEGVQRVKVMPAPAWAKR